MKLNKKLLFLSAATIVPMSSLFVISCSSAQVDYEKVSEKTYEEMWNEIFWSESKQFTAQTIQEFEDYLNNQLSNYSNSKLLKTFMFQKLINSSLFPLLENGEINSVLNAEQEAFKKYLNDELIYPDNRDEGSPNYTENSDEYTFKKIDKVINSIKNIKISLVNVRNFNQKGEGNTVENLAKGPIMSSIVYNFSFEVTDADFLEQFNKIRINVNKSPDTALRWIQEMKNVDTKNYFRNNFEHLSSQGYWESSTNTFTTTLTETLVDKYETTNATNKTFNGFQSFADKNKSIYIDGNILGNDRYQPILVIDTNNSNYFTSHFSGINYWNNYLSWVKIDSNERSKNIELKLTRNSVFIDSDTADQE